MKHKPDGNKKNPDGTQKLLTCAQEGTSEIGDFLMLDTSGKGQTLYWTYDVLFEVRLKKPSYLAIVNSKPCSRSRACQRAQYSDIKWASRWDTYLNSADDDQIHWFSIINSVCAATGKHSNTVSVRTRPAEVL